MLDEIKAVELYDALYNKSTNSSRVRVRITTTPKIDERIELSEISICYNKEYDNWYIKTFWGNKRAYRYRVRYKDLEEWIDLLKWVCINNEDELFK